MNENLIKDKVLIVEDEEDTRFILERLLEKNNYEVKTSRNGEEALEVLKTFKPQVIIADWTMPIMDGLQLCDKLKNDEEFKLVYFILLTARASLKDRVKGLDIGADDFLVKPIENQELLARIRSGIRIYRLQEELKRIEHTKALVEMACTIGHQLNNPLNSLSLMAENIYRDLDPKIRQKYEEEFNIIKLSIERIKQFQEKLKSLDNPELTNYSGDSRMLKIN
jgi:sigma-B regulation protein RsbU (phosphoserine phosphatase)